MKELKERLIKAKKLKFMRNVIVGVIALLIAAFIINIAPGYKRDKYKDVVNLIIDEHNVTEDLKNMLYKIVKNDRHFPLVVLRLTQWEVYLLWTKTKRK